MAESVYKVVELVGTSRLLKNSAKWDRQIDPVVLRCSQHCREPDHARTR